MKILLHKNVAKQHSSNKNVNRYYGTIAKSLNNAIDNIKNVAHFNDLYEIPENFHELSPYSPGIYSLSIKQPFRLVVCPVGQSLKILAVENYHDNPKCIGNYLNLKAA